MHEDYQLAYCPIAHITSLAFADDYGLRGLPQPPSDTVTEDGPIICPEPACNGLVVQGQMHYMNHSAKVHKGPF